tara:strand:+ start:13883 stop:14581 length:699 start_codon:yes stop_codon:yes gene_type:complete
MAQDLAVFDEATARRVLNAIDALEASGLLGPTTDEVKKGYDENRTWNEIPPISVYNDSGHTVPAYGLMQMTTTLNEDGRNYVKVKRPIDSALLRCPLLINGPTEIAVGGYGTAQQGPTFRLLTDGGSYVAGDRLGAKTSTFTATYGALFAVIGSDSIDTNIVRVMFDVSSFKGKTKSVALVVGTPANVYFTDAAGTVTSREYLAETDVSDIPADTAIDLIPMYGRLVAREVC